MTELEFLAEIKSYVENAEKTEDRTGEITLDGYFTREDLIEIANTVPSTEA